MGFVIPDPKSYEFVRVSKWWQNLKEDIIYNGTEWKYYSQLYKVYIPLHMIL